MNVIIKSPTLIQLGDKIIPVNLYDIIELKKINERKIQINKTKGYKIPTNDNNSVYKIASALQKMRPNKFGVTINIQKNVPTFSGLNSQVSNAASVLIGLNKLWKFNLGQKELLKIVKSIDPILTKILKFYFKANKFDKGKIILVRPKYIKINKDWTKSKTTVMRHFPDITEIIKTLNKFNLKQVGLNDIGSVIVGYSEEAIDIKQIKKIIKNKIDFIWIGKTCDNITI